MGMGRGPASFLSLPFLRMHFCMVVSSIVGYLDGGTAAAGGDGDGGGGGGGGEI